MLGAVLFPNQITGISHFGQLVMIAVVVVVVVVGDDFVTMLCLLSLSLVVAISVFVLRVWL